MRNTERVFKFVRRSSSIFPYISHLSNVFSKLIFRRIDDDRGKSYELGQAAVKCMRGILKCWIRLAPKIELFKKNQCNAHALHCKFHLITGDQVCADTYPHLQASKLSSGSVDYYQGGGLCGFPETYQYFCQHAWKELLNKKLPSISLERCQK